MSITVTVTDMSCDGCEDIVEGAVADVSGVDSVEADRSTESVTVEGDADVDAVLQAIDFAGYTPDEDSVTEGEPQPTESEEADAPDDDEDVETTDSDTEKEGEEGEDEDDVPEDDSDEPDDAEEDEADDE